MFKLKSTLAAGIALAIIGGIIACSSQMANRAAATARRVPIPARPKPPLVGRRPRRQPRRFRPSKILPKSTNGLHQPYRPPRRQEAQHPLHHGRRHRLDAAELLSSRPDGRRNAQHRPHRERRRDVHALLRRAELHRRAQRILHRHAPAAHRHGPAAIARAARSYLRPGTPALAVFLLDLGYTTGEFGKNHLGDHPASLPTAHGFQEFWGYLYHLDAMQQVSFPDINRTPDRSGHRAAPAR